MHSFNRRLLLVTTILTLTGFAGFATGQTLLPLNGQNAEQIKSDDMACQNQATSTTTPATEQPQGGRLAGAVKGGLVGAAAAEVRGNQYEAYDRLDDDVQQEYRQENALDAAAVGAVIGGRHQRKSDVPNKWPRPWRRPPHRLISVACRARVTASPHKRLMA